MIWSLVRITFGQRQQHSCSLQGSTHCVVHLRTFGSRYRQSDDDEGLLISSMMANRPVTQRGIHFPLGQVFPVILSGEYHATKYHPGHGAHCVRG
ncbi:hypothetical protein [Xenorhabdus bovienii]|uniref:hypothetical protein n=1 Tax=Xenorhabdus bovienii TaxID=40576 RepID=UPI0012D46111|nr:hypothetical protein [Xenorhabdus bovienii]